MTTISPSTVEPRTGTSTIGEYEYKKVEPTPLVCPILSIGQSCRLCIGNTCAMWHKSGYGVHGGCGLCRG